ncbi:hypothetical protein HDV05_003800 [Chytridiales sp. JEL 0842]|nr:hypothetical protein HDV05_003800 [Chytridiales sp. JEL 0842]
MIAPVQPVAVAPTDPAGTMPPPGAPVSTVESSSPKNLSRQTSRSLKRSLSEIVKRNTGSDVKMNAVRDDSLSNLTTPRKPASRKDSQAPKSYGDLSAEELDLLASSALQRLNNLLKARKIKPIGTDILKSLQLVSGTAVEKKKWWTPPWTKKDGKEADNKADGGQLVIKTALCKSIEYASVQCEAETSFNVRRIPIIVHECVKYLKANGLKSNGLFRVNGSEKRIAQMAVSFDEGPKYGFGFEFQGYTVYDVADLLKKYIRGLPEPLLTTDLYSHFIKCLEIPVEDGLRLKAFRWLLMMLPPPHLVLLEYLLELFALVAMNSAANQMTASNLARIFSPNLLKPKSEKQALEEFQSCSYVVEFMIDNFDQFCITSRDMRPFEMLDASYLPPKKLENPADKYPASPELAPSPTTPTTTA